MSPGKAAAQAGHAFLNAFLDAYSSDTQRCEEYHKNDGIGTKVCLQAKSETALEILYQKARDAGIPCTLVVDSDHVIPGSPFDGDPIITAVGIGPTTRAESKRLLSKYNLVK